MTPVLSNKKIGNLFSFNNSLNTSFNSDKDINQLHFNNNDTNNDINNKGEKLFNKNLFN